MTSLFALSFLNPFLLWGAGLASIPLIIHILNRRRFKIVHWAAMEFLLRAFKENRRRIRFEQWLLLLLRIGVVALLAFLLARPKASADQFGPWRSKVHHLVILDESGSMTETTATGLAFDIAKQQVLSRLEAIARERGNSSDLFTLFRSSSAKPDFFARPVSLQLLAKVKDFLKPLRPTPARFKLAECLDRANTAARKVKDKVDRAYLYVMSDFRQRDLLGNEGKIDEDVLKNLRKIDPNKILLSPAGRTENANVAIVGVGLQEARAIRGQDARFEIVVANQGGKSSGEMEVGFMVDGAARKSRMIPSLGPGETHTEKFKTVFTTAGHHWVEADLPKDRIVIDDHRVLAFPVAESARVLLVDGDPGESEDRRETFYLEIALDPAGNASAGMDVTRINDSEISERDFGGYDFIVLANVATIDDETVARLEKFTQSGGGLMFTCGDQVGPEAWNRLFWKGGKGLLPAPLKDIAGDMDKPDSIVVSDIEHPLFGDATTGESLRAPMSLVSVGRYMLTGSENDGVRDGQVPADARVLLRASDENGPPLLVERSFGKGRVALCTTTADASWTPWASNPTYLVLVRMAAEWLMRREDLGPLNVTAGATVSQTLLAADYRPEVRLGPARQADEDRITERGFSAQPRAEDPDLLQLDATPPDGRVWAAAGCYKLTLVRSDDTEEPVFFSVSAWKSEGVTLAVDRRQLLAMLPQELRDRTIVVDEGVGQAGLLSDEGEFWRFLAFVVLAGLFVETLLAWRFGHR